VSKAPVAEKIRAIKAGTEGTFVAHTGLTDSDGVYGWFLEVGSADDFRKASNAFKSASAIVDRLANIENA
jgi:hypothetical protein